MIRQALSVVSFSMQWNSLPNLTSKTDTRIFIRHQRLENTPFTMKNSPAKVRLPGTIFYSHEETLSKYFPITLHLSPATRILSENPVIHRCPQLVPIGTRTTRHFNKGYVCMYVYTLFYFFKNQRFLNFPPKFIGHYKLIN